MRLTKVGFFTALSLLVLGLVEVILKIIYSSSLSYGLSFVLNDPGKTLFHLVLLPVAAAILLSKLPVRLITYLFGRIRYFPTFLFLILVTVAIYEVFSDHLHPGADTALMPYEVRGAPAALSALRLDIARQVTQYHQTDLPDDAQRNKLQQAKQTYAQQVSELRSRSKSPAGSFTVYYWYAMLLNCIGVAYAVLLFVLTLSLIAGKVELEDRRLDAFILNIFILSPWIILRAYSEWYFSMGNYHLAEDSKLVVIFFLSILLVMQVAFLRKSRGFIRTFFIGVVLLIGTGGVNILLNPEWIPGIISLFSSLSPFALFSMSVLFLISAVAITWNRIKTMAYLQFISMGAAQAAYMEDDAEKEEVGPAEADHADKQEKHAAPGLTDDTCREYASRLEGYFRQHKPYLDPELTIKSVADALNIPLHHLSWVVNEWLGHSFPDYVNVFRIEEAKQKLRSPEFRQLKIENIGYGCGFNSKATFNRVFKKYCNVSPSQYQKSCPGDEPDQMHTSPASSSF